LEITIEDLINLGHNDTAGGIGSHQEIEELNKALSTGGPAYSDTLIDDFAQGQVFQMESLEPTLLIVSEIDKHVNLFNMLNKQKSFQLVESYDLQTSHGGAGTAWIDEDDNEPAQEDATYNREIEIVKYMGVKKQVSHVMTQIRSAHGDVVAKETRNGVSYLLREIERQLYDGNGFYSQEGAGAGQFDGLVDLNKEVSWNGVEKQLRGGFQKSERKHADFIGFGDDLSHVLDIDAQTLSPEDIEESTRVAKDDFGMPDKILLSPKAHSDFSRSYYPKERFNDGKGNIIPGTIVPAMNTTLGKIELISNKFLTPKQKGRSIQDNPQCLLASASVPTGVSPADGTDLTAANYFYGVRAINKRGEGAASLSASITAAAGDRVDLTISAPTVSAGIIGYAVYRGLVADITKMEFIGRVKANGASNVVFSDKNLKKPGTSLAYLLQSDAEAMVLKQLTPMLKIDFAIIGLFRHWAQVYYGTPIVFKPNYSVLMDNVKEN